MHVHGLMSICVCVCVFFVCMHRNNATHRQHSKDCVDGPDSYCGVDRLTDASSSKDSRRVIKDLEDKTSTDFP